ncbi:hypothetical protein [Actinomadura alba]|uniref:hypothetical protein n=1 Tax=Actinomadura alba TaxID=406431 RepID=UPI00164EF827|nr:hypothetical protein [Actinomadura alba]
MASADQIDFWRPARKFPEHYPGECPLADYLLWNRHVHPLEYSDTAGFVIGGNEHRSLDDLLAALELPGLAERTPVLAYGANRNPATLHVKLLNYGYRSPNGTDWCVPVLRGELHGADVAVAGLHGHGYLYGELLLNTEYSRDAVLQARICLVDADQLRVLNDSEEIREGSYHLARIPRTRLVSTGAPVQTLGYVANAHTWSSPVHGTPIGYTSVQATGRRYPSMTATDGLAHALDALDIRRQVSALSGIADDDRMAAELAKYLNGQWWYRFQTGQAPIAGYESILEIFRAAMADSSLPVRTYDHLAELGQIIPVEAAYSPDNLLGRVQPND